MNKPLNIALAAVAAAMLLAACGKKESTTPSPTSSTSAPTSSASTSPAPGTTASAPGAESTPSSSATSPMAAASASPSGNAAAAAAGPGASASAPGAAATTTASAGGGEGTYNTTCVACHGAGVAGAPKFGDKADWGPRIAQGKQVLYTHAIQGFQGQKGVMPPKGGAANLSDDDVKAAVDYMVSKAG